MKPKLHQIMVLRTVSVQSSVARCQTTGPIDALITDHYEALLDWLELPIDEVAAEITREVVLST